MIFSRYSKLLMCLIGITLLSNSHARDIADSHDHPLITRYPSSSILHFEENEFSRYRLPLSAPQKISSKEYTADKIQTLEGKITRIVYSAPEDSSELQIYQNYLNAFKKPGFDLVYTCTEGQCGATAKTFGRFLNQSRVSYHDKAQPYFLIASLARDGQSPVYVVTLIGRTNSKKKQIIVDVVETKGMEVGKIATNADALLDSLMQTGRAQIYDIYFDTGKSEIKPESSGALSAIAEVLAKRSDIDLYVVGHTDDTGSLPNNIKLSGDRADAIVNNLRQIHNIEANRLHGAGVGPFSPISSNDNVAGRAKNRRVELVKRLD